MTHPSVLLTVGLLDYGSITVLRQALRECPTGPDVHLALDLSRAGVDHDLTLFAILADSVRVLHAAGSAVTALRPTASLAHLLTRLGVTVLSHPDTSWGDVAVERVEVGAL